MWPLRSLMAAAPDNGMLRPSGPAPLGAILVQRGVLTEEQLAFALDEQKRTGEQIGEVIVRLGLALAPSVAQALATQHGSPLKTEYGYAVGFGGTYAGSSGRPAACQSRPGARQSRDSTRGFRAPDGGASGSRADANPGLRPSSDCGGCAHSACARPEPGPVAAICATPDRQNGMPPSRRRGPLPRSAKRRVRTSMR